MDIHTPEINQRVAQLENEVAPYSMGRIKPSGIFSNFSFSYKTLYVVVPVLILVLLVTLRPKFVKNEIVGVNGSVTYKFSFKRLLLFWLLFSFVLILGVFGASYKRA